MGHLKVFIFKKSIYKYMIICYNSIKDKTERGNKHDKDSMGIKKQRGRISLHC